MKAAGAVLSAVLILLFLSSVCSFQGRRMREVVMQLSEDINPQDFASKYKLEYVGKHLDFHIFKKSSTESDYDFSQHDEVLFHEHQIARPRVKRGDWSKPNDPNYGSQWHLHYTSSVLDSNINVESVWQSGIFGRGVTVGIVDDGIDPNANDIKQQFNASLSYDYNFYDNDPTPYSWDIHGTEAATVASGTMNNRFCGVGVAPLSQSVGIRLLAQDVSDLQESQALSHLNNQVFIYSNSWGPYDDGRRLEGPGPLAQKAIYDSIMNGRGKKGSIYVWACGNGKSSGDSCSYDGYANSKFTIAVAAVRHDKKTTYYSEACAAVLISSPSSDNSGYAISTGSTKSSCVSNFGGTSAACPMVAGVVALMLEANPELTWRDVQAILVKTANSDTIYEVSTTDDEWTFNEETGLRHNNKFGFGMIDSKRAVETALTWQNLPTYINVSSSLKATSQSNRAMVFNLTITDSKKFIVEHVEFSTDISVSQRGKLLITITSPSGIKAILHYYHGDNGANIRNTVDGKPWTYVSVKHWGEEANGSWLIEVVPKSVSFTVNYGLLNIWGHHE